MEKRQAKEARKVQRLADNAERRDVDGDVDPDLANLKPGPQAPPPWLTDDLDRMEVG